MIILKVLLIVSGPVANEYSFEDYVNLVIIRNIEKSRSTVETDDETEHAGEVLNKKFSRRLA